MVRKVHIGILENNSYRYFWNTFHIIWHFLYFWGVVKDWQQLSTKCRPAGVDRSRKSIGNKQNRTKPGWPLPPWKIQPQYQFGWDNEGEWRVGLCRWLRAKVRPEKGGLSPFATSENPLKTDRSGLTWPDICPRLGEPFNGERAGRRREGADVAAADNLFIRPHSTAHPPASLPLN